MFLKRSLASLLVALPLLASCRADDKLNSPNVLDPMFRRYVSVGNSITAGFQSGGINDSTQVRAYPNLLAMAMGTPFNLPLFATHPQLGKGCPPPIDVNSVNPPHRVGNGSGGGCSLRVPVSGFVNNVAFPGAEVAELLDNMADQPSATDVYKQFILGGRTEVELMQALQPTFVSVWIGANDVLGALLSPNPGDPAAVTDPNAFATSYTQVLDAIEATGARAVLVSVPNVTVIPYASSAAIYWCLKNGDGQGGDCPAPFPPRNPLLQNLAGFTVDPNCAPVPPAGGGINVLVPWTIALTKLATAAGGGNATLDCSVDNEVITPQEAGNIVAAVTAYNQHIQTEATNRGYAYFDINGPLNAALADSLLIRRFPDFVPALGGGNVTFGSYFSLDGFHPSSLANQAIADGIAAAINAHYGTSLPVPVCGAVTCPAP